MSYEMTAVPIREVGEQSEMIAAADETAASNSAVAYVFDLEA